MKEMKLHVTDIDIYLANLQDPQFTIFVYLYIWTSCMFNFDTLRMFLDHSGSVVDYISNFKKYIKNNMFEG